MSFLDSVSETGSAFWDANVALANGTMDVLGGAASFVTDTAATVGGMAWDGAKAAGSVLSDVGEGVIDGAKNVGMFVATAADGATMGLGKEVVAGAVGLGSMATGNGFFNGYGAASGAMNGALNDFAAEHPTAANVAWYGGAVASAIGTGGMAVAGRGALAVGKAVVGMVTGRTAAAAGAAEIGTAVAGRAAVSGAEHLAADVAGGATARTAAHAGESTAMKAVDHAGTALDVGSMAGVFDDNSAVMGGLALAGAGALVTRRGRMGGAASHAHAHVPDTHTPHAPHATHSSQVPTAKVPHVEVPPRGAGMKNALGGFGGRAMDAAGTAAGMVGDVMVGGMEAMAGMVSAMLSGILHAMGVNTPEQEQRAQQRPQGPEMMLGGTRGMQPAYAPAQSQQYHQGPRRPTGRAR